MYNISFRFIVACFFVNVNNDMYWSGDKAPCHTAGAQRSCARRWSGARRIEAETESLCPCGDTQTDTMTLRQK